MNNAIVSASLVPERRRINVLPKRFDRCVRIEAALFDVAQDLIDGYDGGYWEFFTLSNGGLYMVPQIEGKSARGMDHLVRVRVAGNGYDDEMTREAAGIVCCLMAFSHESFNASGRYQKQLAEQFHLLRDFAADHAEAASIFAAID